MNYFIAPRSGERSYRNFQSTIKHGVPYENIVNFLNDEGKQKLLSEPVIYAWGNRAGTRTQWERMQEGDTVIFYAKGELVMTGEVYYKQHNPSLALAMWPTDENGNPWEYTFFLKNIQYIKIPMKAFNIIAGYKPNFIIQGFTRLKEHRLELITQQYGSIEYLLNSFNTKVSAEAPKASDKIYVNLDETIEPEIRFDTNLHPKQPSQKSLKVLPRKINYLEKNKNNALVGSKGEVLVVNEEKKRLGKLDRTDLSEKVKRVSVDDDSLGYDILSFEQDGSERFIEVKTSSSKSDNLRFFMSSNEMAKSKITNNYYIYYVDGINTSKPRITIISYPFAEKFLITTHNFMLEAINNE